MRTFDQEFSPSKGWHADRPWQLTPDGKRWVYRWCSSCLNYKHGGRATTCTCHCHHYEQHGVWSSTCEECAPGFDKLAAMFGWQP